VNIFFDFSIVNGPYFSRTHLQSQLNPNWNIWPHVKCRNCLQHERKGAKNAIFIALLFVINMVKCITKYWKATPAWWLHFNL